MNAPVTLTTRVEERMKVTLASDALSQASGAATQLAALQFPRDAALYADLRAIVKSGIRFLRQEYKAIADPLNMALDALRARVNPQINQLEASLKSIDDRFAAWQREEARRKEQERIAAEDAARSAAARATEALDVGEEPPPPAEYGPPEAPRVLVRGATGKGVTTSRVLQVELVSAIELAAYAPGLLKLDTAGAKNLIRGELAKGDLLIPDDGSVVFQGIKAWYSTSVGER